MNPEIRMSKRLKSGRLSFGLRHSFVILVSSFVIEKAMACTTPNPITNPWPHRLAVLLCVATFPLLFVGAMVTTRQAGMAVPDWPTTFGYNMFLYPLSSWFAAPWNVFVEHGHRLFGALVGMLTIALVLALWLRDDRHWLRALGLFALVLVIGQGVLGGMRVRLNEQLLAQVHGCVAPLFFATTVALCVFTSRLWRSADREAEPKTSRRIQVVALVLTVLAYAQLVIGSELRHIAADASTDRFRIAVWFHLLLAAGILVHAIMLWIRVMRLPEKISTLRRPAGMLAGIVLLQIALGGSTWLLKYGWPAGLPGTQPMAGWTNTAGTLMPSLVVTAHVAIGSLVLGLSLMLALRSLRLLAPLSGMVTLRRRTLEAAR